LQVIDALQRGEGTLGGIFCPQTLEMFWPTLQQPAELRTNGCYGWIQQINLASLNRQGISW
jgi:hypothetical protein